MSNRRKIKQRVMSTPAGDVAALVAAIGAGLAAREEHARYVLGMRAPSLGKRQARQVLAEVAAVRQVVELCVADGRLAAGEVLAALAAGFAAGD